MQWSIWSNAKYNGPFGQTPSQSRLKCPSFSQKKHFGRSCFAGVSRYFLKMFSRAIITSEPFSLRSLESFSRMGTALLTIDGLCSIRTLMHIPEHLPFRYSVLIIRPVETECHVINETAHSQLMCKLFWGIWVGTFTSVSMTSPLLLNFRFKSFHIHLLQVLTPKFSV